MHKIANIRRMASSAILLPILFGILTGMTIIAGITTSSCSYEEVC